MTQTDIWQLKKELNSMFDVQMDKLKGEFVTKTEIMELTKTVAKHDKVYVRVHNLLVYIGVLATFQMIFGNSWKTAFELVKKVLGL